MEAFYIAVKACILFTLIVLTLLRTRKRPQGKPETSRLCVDKTGKLTYQSEYDTSS